MARFQTTGIDELIQKFETGGIDEETTDAMLQAGAEITKGHWKRSAEAAGHRRTGDMIDSIGYKPKPKRTEDTKKIDVYPLGTDRKGTRNGQKAFTLNYGSSEITGSRFVDAAEKSADPEASKAMEEILTKKLKEKGLID